MIYGLYLSATGIMANSHRQDVIANNLANAETTGFKRNTVAFKQRLTAAQEDAAKRGFTNPLEENIGGGLFINPTGTDLAQGDLESTGNNLDLAIEGKGYFAVDDHGTTRLTRAGAMMMDRNGNLIMANGSGQRVLDRDLKPIKLDPGQLNNTLVGNYGEISQNQKDAGHIGLFDVDDPHKLTKKGANMLDASSAGSLKPALGMIRSNHLERANVDPATELTQLMDAQRQREANANMIRYQDETLGHAVNELGKLS